MSEIIVSSDSDFRATIKAQEMADRVGNILTTTYPGYRWRIEPHPHATRPFVDFEVEAGVMGTRVGHLGATVVLSDFYSASSLDAKIRDLAGKMLELSGLNRRAFNETEFMARPLNAFGLFDALGTI